MGQYYIPIILGVKTLQEYIRVWIDAHAYSNGMKLMEHSYVGNPVVSTVEYLISCDGPFYRSRLVWAGDYADEEPEIKENLYNLARGNDHKNNEKLWGAQHRDTTAYRFIVNHTKKQYVDKNPLKHAVHPLPLLTSEGNGRGGGDYRGNNETLCGIWARDEISLEHTQPEGFTELQCEFIEG